MESIPQAEGSDEVIIMTVDGTHCRVEEPRKAPSRKWYSEKFQAAGLAYEVGVAVRHNMICWINGPFPAGTHDITMFRSEGGLWQRIPQGRLVFGDKGGYQGEPDWVIVDNEFDSEELIRYRARALARHETINRRLKNFRVLDRPFRHGVGRHGMVFDCVAVLVQYELENGHPLFAP